MGGSHEGRVAGGDGRGGVEEGAGDSTPEQWSETEFAERLRQGDEAAWRHFDRVLRPELLEHAMRMAGDRDEAEDLVSLVTLAILEQPEGWCSGSVRGLAHCMLRSEAGHLRRGDKRRQCREEKAAELLGRSPQGPDYALDWKRRWRLVGEAVDRLPERQTEAWILRHMECRGLKEVAGRMKISVSGTKKLLGKADAKVREYCQGGASTVVARLRERVGRRGGVRFRGWRALQG